MKYLKNRDLIIDNKVLIYWHLQFEKQQKFFISKFNILTIFTKENSFCFLFFKKLDNPVGFMTPVWKKWRIRIKSIVTAPALLVILSFM